MPTFSHLVEHCADTKPIPASEFHLRQQALAEKLHALGGAAYIAEPGANALYFANLSLAQWWLSERPFLLIITPILQEQESHNGERVAITPVVRSQVLILTPQFEYTRAKLLHIPTSSNVTFIPWAESESPYKAVVSALKKRHRGQMPKIFVDEGSRFFIVDGIEQISKDFIVENSPSEIQALRESKSSAELALLRCANEVTLMALREVRRHLYFGIRESDAKALILQALMSAGLKNVDALVLFGENAALPHGSGTDRQLGEDDFALFDMMGSLHGYYSDLTRTIALPTSKIPSKHLEVWYTVHAAQSAAKHAAHRGVKASEVDSAAREVIGSVGAGQYFTHRLGHGIGIQVHESPYLRGGNEALLAIGNVFSNEPGIYIEHQVGVRLEDCFFIDEQGKPVLLTAGVGGQAASPWNP